MDRNRIDREVLLAHVTGKNRVLFTYSWLYDGGIHFYPSVRFSANIIEDNYKLRLTMRNITDRRTGRWDGKVTIFVIHDYWKPLIAAGNEIPFKSEIFLPFMI